MDFKISFVSAALCAITKLRQGKLAPSQYTERELEALERILRDKVRRLDMSPVDLRTASGLERLEFALAAHQFGFDYYLKQILK